MTQTTNLKSGIYLDDEFIGITWHSVNTYFETLRKVIDSGESARLMLPTEEGLTCILITPHTRLRSFTARSEANNDIFDESLTNHPYGNFPVILDQYLDADDEQWETINMTSLGEAVTKMRADREAEATTPTP